VQRNKEIRKKSEEKSTFTGHRQYGWTQENIPEREVLPSPAMSSVLYCMNHMKGHYSQFMCFASSIVFSYFIQTLNDL